MYLCMKHYLLDLSYNSKNTNKMNSLLKFSIFTLTLLWKIVCEGY